MFSAENPTPSVATRITQWMVKLVITMALGFVLIFSLYTWSVLKYVYARGERAGYLQKLSQKGWLFKTWEGEMALVNLPGAMPEIFYFSIRNDDIAKKVMSHLGGRVTLTYEQHRGLPINWFAETEYFVTDLRPIVDQEPIPLSTPAPANEKPSASKK